MPSTILLIFYDLGLGGIQTKIVDIVNYFGKHYPSVSVHLLLRTRSSFDRGYLIENPKAVIHTYSQDIKYIRGPFFFTLYVIYLCWTISPEAILSFLSPFSLPVLLTKIILFWKKKTIVINEDNYTSGVISGYKYKLLNDLGIRLFYRLANSIIVPTKAVKQDLVEEYHVPRHKVIIIPNWTSFKIRSSASKKKSFDLVYVGRLDKTKRVDMLVSSIIRLKQIYRDIVLYIVGNGTEKPSLEQYVKENKLVDNIIFADAQYNIQHIIQQSKVFIFSSQKRGEGFPMAVLEAMATGIPILAYNFAGANETINDGVNGYLYTTQKEIIQKCILLLRNPQKRIKFIKNATKTIRLFHSIKNIDGYARLLGYV